MPDTPEHWRDIAGYVGRYQVSSLGRVRSLKRKHAGARILKPAPTGGGYLAVSPSIAGRSRTMKIHVAVAEAFLAPPPGPIGCGASDYQINHRDGDKANNAAANLEYITRAENSAHAAANGLNARGAKHGLSKLTPEAVREIRRLSGRVTQSRLAERYGVTRSNVGHIIRRRSWRHIT